MAITGQPGKNVVVAYKAETTMNVLVTGTGATVFRAAPGQGGNLTRAEVKTTIFRSDAQTDMSRLGSRSLDVSYESDLSVGTFDALVASLFRNTYSALVSLTSADFTNLVVSTHTVTAAGGNFLTNFRVGDVFKIVGSAQTLNNNRNLRVTAVATLALAVADTLTVQATDTSPAIVLPKRVQNPIAGTSLVRSSYTLQEYYEDLNDSKVFTGNRVSSMKLDWAPDAPTKITFGFVGSDMIAPPGAANFSAPTVSTSIELASPDAVMRVNGADVAILTAGSITVNLNAKGQPVLGSAVTPDIYEGSFVPTGTISGVRTSLTNITTFLAETEFEIHFLAQDNASAPQNFISFYLGRCKYTGNNASFGNDGPIIEQMPFMAAAHVASNGYDAVTMRVVTSAA